MPNDLTRVLRKNQFQARPPGDAIGWRSAGAVRDRTLDAHYRAFLACEQGNSPLASCALAQGPPQITVPRAVKPGWALELLAWGPLTSVSTAKCRCALAGPHK